MHTSPQKRKVVLFWQKMKKSAVIMDGLKNGVCARVCVCTRLCISQKYLLKYKLMQLMDFLRIFVDPFTMAGGRIFEKIDHNCD